MPELLIGLAGVMTGVLLDQGLQVVRDARAHRRERTEAERAADAARIEAIESAMQRIENHVSGNSGLIKGIIAGRIHLDDDDEGR